MKRILIEWLHCDGQETSGRSPAEVAKILASAVEAMRPFLRTMQTQVDVREVRLTADEMELSGTVKVNGREIAAGENLSVETLTDAVLGETARFTGGGCAGNPEDLYR